MSENLMTISREVGASITSDILFALLTAVVVFLWKKIKEYKKRKKRDKELIDFEIDFF